ncbi:GNAT family N-acetyltransferase [Nonomuraea sp. NPDC050680]|uniref:GNAT family N-acetyltransferase n=1 Tax=Nonomuraea sp. NPDC050680 TaxID=3154630 RepID=UPI0033CEEB0A
MNSTPEDGITLAVCPPLTDHDLNDLFAASWPGHEAISFAPILGRSLCWIAAHHADRLVGFVNVATDGGIHAFVLDTTVRPAERRAGLGVRLVRAAADEAKARGAEWLHVDYEPHLEGFYAQCGFRPTAAGLMRL